MVCLAGRGRADVGGPVDGADAVGAPDGEAGLVAVGNVTESAESPEHPVVETVISATVETSIRQHRLLIPYSYRIRSRHAGYLSAKS
jgi:hypothetical protein